MITTTHEQRRQIERLDRVQLRAHQLARVNRLLATILPHNEFYAEKFAAHFGSSAGVPCLASFEDFCRLPYTFKDELASPRHPGELVANLTFPRERYTRFHQTSGTRGRPLVVLDTPEDWAWWIDCWQFVFDAAQVDAGECVFMAFSFGPFIGFWSAFDAACARGCLVVPGGGLNSPARLELLRRCHASVMLCTPSYALHLAEVGRENHIDVADLDVTKLILAGEPGGSIPETRARISELWQADVFDHSGASEVGPWGYGDAEGRGLYVNEHDFIAEFLSHETGKPAADGDLSELVLTNLGRTGTPIVRYRTGDLVRPRFHHDGARRFVFLEGGVIGRADDMMVIRGVNVFPSSVEQIVRSFPEVIEYRLTVHTKSAMDQLLLEIEDRLNDPGRVAAELHLRLGLKVEVRTVPFASLPRVEGKGKRFVDER